MPEDKNNIEKTTQGHTVISSEKIGVATALRKPLELPRLTFSHFLELKARHRRRELWLFSTLGVSVLLLPVTVLAYNSSFALGHIKLASLSVGLNSDNTQLAREMRTATDDYRFTLHYPDKPPQTFKLSDAGISVNTAQTLSNLRSSKQDLGWGRFAFWHTTVLPLAMSKNNKQFASFVDQHITIANQDAKDASIAAVNGKPAVTDGSDGWTYTLPEGNEQLIQSAGRLKPLDVAVTKTSTKPALQKADLTTAGEMIESFTAHSVTFSLPSRTVTANAGDIGSWLDIQAQPDLKTADVTVNSGKVQAWLDKATKNDVRPPVSQITTTDDSGNTTVLIAGQNGMSITNKAAAVSSVANLLAQPSKEIHADLAVAYKQFSTIKAADFPKWLVVDLTTKRMYAYEHATLTRSFLVSAGAPKTPTVVGTYKIYSKYRSKDMRGSNADGTRYFQPHVHFVNYFYKDYAVHGNYWRPTSYFGNINSSHGCVGIVDSEAAWLYDWAPIGTTVITHY